MVLLAFTVLFEPTTKEREPFLEVISLLSSEAFQFNSPTVLPVPNAPAFSALTKFL